VQLDVAAAQNSDTIVIANPGYPDPSPAAPRTVTPSRPSSPAIRRRRDAERQPRSAARNPSAVGVGDGVYSRGKYQFNNATELPLFPGGPRPDPRSTDIMFGWKQLVVVGALEQRAVPAAARTVVRVSYTLSKSLRDVEDFQYFAQDELIRADKGRRTTSPASAVVTSTGTCPAACSRRSRLVAIGIAVNVTTASTTTSTRRQTTIGRTWRCPAQIRSTRRPTTRASRVRVGNLPRNVNRGRTLLTRRARVETLHADRG